MAKNATKMHHFQAKISKISGEGTVPSPDPTPTGEGNTPDQTAHPWYIFVHLLFVFLRHCTYKSSHGKALIWSGKVMEIDFSKVVGTMVTPAAIDGVWCLCRSRPHVSARVTRRRRPGQTQESS